MRALIDDPRQLSTSQYRRFVQQAQTCGRLADHLVEGEPYLALNAIILDRDDSALLRRLTGIFSRVFDKVGRTVASDVALLIELGFPWVAAELLSADNPRIPIVGRFDFVRDDRGRWWLLEFNGDTPSGIREAIVADHLAYDLLPDAHSFERANANLDRAFIPAFRSATADLPGGTTLGLVTTVGELEDLAQMAFTRDLLRAPLAEQGIGVVLGDTDNLGTTRTGLTLCGRRLGALYRYVPFEGMIGTPAFAAVYDNVMAGRLRLLNGLYGLLLQNKGLLAWIWAHRDDPMFDDDERAAIADHLPPTWWIQEYPEDVGPIALVAKQVFGREGEEVFFGEDLSAEDWDGLRRRRTYVAQWRVPLAEVTPAIPTSAGLVRSRGHATVGCYAVDGAWAGYYTRFGGKIITARAKWLATFIA